MKHLRTYEGLDYAEDAGLYDEMTDLLDKANIIHCEFKGENPEEWEMSGPEEAMELLSEIDDASPLYRKSSTLYDEIEDLNNKIDELDSEEYHDLDERIDFWNKDYWKKDVPKGKKPRSLRHQFKDIVTGRDSYDEEETRAKSDFEVMKVDKDGTLTAEDGTKYDKYGYEIKTFTDFTDEIEPDEIGPAVKPIHTVEEPEIEEDDNKWNDNEFKKMLKKIKDK